MITKSNCELANTDFNLGEVLLIDKPMDWTSFKVVNVVRKHCKAKKVGHAGTLDPKATGLLILCTGKKTKEITTYQDLGKTYTGSIQLGIRTPSMDLETEVIKVREFGHITEEQIYKAKSSFEGIIDQIPPMYSAIKLNGKTLYNLARKGKTVERQPRKIEISKFEIKSINLPYVEFEICCSKGTYIRSIADDFGEVLGCGGVLSSLRRTKIGCYSVEDAFEVEEFLKNLSDYQVK
ncbi:MAG: tRNA pseudouridine(55) synthase TruB [Bacteroidota bacterium]|nr:tRNA pseudouridine(55) synthase TruB [Bacteroidota bacterium]